MPTISTKNVAQAIYAAAKDKSGDELTRAMANAVEFLAKKNLLSKAPKILEDLENIHNADQGIVSAKVSSKTPLTKYTIDEIRHILKSRYKANEIVVHEKEDKSLLGGIRIEAKDEIIDLSLKNKLNKLHNYLLTN